MITTAESPEVLRNKIKSSLDIMDTDELKRLYQLIAGIAAEKATKLADMDWDLKDMSRDKINEELKNFRHSKDK
jgi:hypothetical protein